MGLKFDMLMNPDHLFNGLHFGHGVLIFLILGYFDLAKLIKFAVARHFLENAWEEWAKMLMYPDHLQN